MKVRKIFIGLCVALIMTISFLGERGSLLEELGVPGGISQGTEKIGKSINYTISFLTYIYNDNKLTTTIFTGNHSTLAETRENRQLKAPKKMMIGFNMLYIYDDATARRGLRPFVTINFTNPEINDMAINVVYKGKSEDMLKYKPKSYNDSAKFINEMISNITQYNFFGDDNKMIDLIVRMGAEGRSIVLPYIDLKNKHIEVIGMGIFKRDKMIGVANIGESRVINILREDSAKGMLTLKENYKKAINCYVTSKRKVKCYRKNGKYNFVVNLNLAGDVVYNDLYNNLNENTSTMKMFEKHMQKHMEKIFNTAVKKIQKKYKTDVWEFGRVAAATYGRGTGTDWDKVVTNSNIKVKVKIKINSEGRGKY